MHDSPHLVETSNWADCGYEASGTRYLLRFRSILAFVRRLLEFFVSDHLLEVNFTLLQLLRVRVPFLFSFLVFSFTAWSILQCQFLQARMVWEQMMPLSLQIQVQIFHIQE